MEFFLTGGTGFVGSHVLKTALKNNHIINALRRSPNSFPKINLDKGLNSTFVWYLNNKKFFSSISKKLYDKRLGLKIND